MYVVELEDEGGILKSICTSRDYTKADDAFIKARRMSGVRVRMYRTEGFKRILLKTVDIKPVVDDRKEEYGE